MTDAQRPGPRWEYDLEYDLRQTALLVDGALSRESPRPAFAAELEARLMGEVQKRAGASRSRRPSWTARLRWPTTALGILLPLVVVAFVLYTVLPTLTAPVFTRPPAVPAPMPAPTPLSDKVIAGSWFKPLILTHLSTKLHLSAQACGFTVTLDSAYVDTEYAVFGYTVTAPRGRVLPKVYFDAQFPTLTDLQGHGFVDTGSAWVGPPVGTSWGKMAIFRAPVGIVLPHTLRLRLILPSVKMTELRTRASSALRPCERTMHDDVTETNQPRNLYTTVAQGPFTFPLTVSVPPHHVSTVHKTVQLNGATLLVQRVEMTPLVTRIYYELRKAKGTRTAAVTYLGQIGPAVPAALARARPWLIFTDQKTFLRWQIWAAAQDCNMPQSARASVCTGPVWARAWRAAARQRTLYIGLPDMPYADHTLYSVDYLAPLYTYHGEVALLMGTTSTQATRARDKTRLLLRFPLSPRVATGASSDVLP